MSSSAATWEARLPLHPEARILAFHSCGLLALEKPPGILSHPNPEADDPGGPERCLLQASYDLAHRLYYWTDAQGKEQGLWLCNRLDSPTSGVLLVATDADLAAAIAGLFARQEVEKLYYAVVSGKLRPPSQHWRDRLRTGREQGTVRTRASEGEPGPPAVTRVRAVKAGVPALGLGLVRLSPLTGRTHQLRVQCARRNHPILGDRTYGDFELNRALATLGAPKRLYLHSGETRLNFFFKGERISFEAQSPLPREFNQVLQLHPARQRTKPASPQQRFLNKLDSKAGKPGTSRREQLKRRHRRPR